MKKRLFVAINLPEEIKDRIKRIVREIQPLFDASTRLSINPERNRRIDGEIRFLKPETWHLTITFLGYEPDDAISAIIDSMKHTAKEHSNILKNVRIIFEKIILAPPGRKPRMIWLVGDKKSSETLSKTKNTLEDELFKNGVKFQRENRPYNTHLTLARFNPILRTSDVQNIEQKLRDIGCPKIEFTPQSLDLMESHLKRTGAEYEVLAKIPFQDL